MNEQEEEGERRRRFTCFCCDTVLIGVWLGILGLLVLALVFWALPSLPILIRQRTTNAFLWAATTWVFLGWTAWRILAAYDVTVWCMPFSYVAAQVVIASLWTTGIMPRPLSIVTAPIVPSLFLSVACVPLSYAWQRIKPRPRRKRDVAVLRRAREAALASRRKRDE